ncbi:MAG: 30S ribosomal protein S4 [Methanosaeta sp. PtaB.Bin039]|nr:MAG: 30S ribosomal protein S4 [Methanosaeta sp. PtaB.Bin039]OPY45861.1 MAG: 30S ribosomal protein S4 [Methanosaeta sp. PtaU1.Bin028]HOT07813.1 30S ribosomal protein S4 [Methanotrichaceae archaeon]HQF17554.1 30S ribosomal protein S4 [Methanotrichaceae archaeon]HQI92104.1 30S ribosomal protein S4 [Methanotrichaceae archaeon]
MGYPGKNRKTYERPLKPWEATRMAEEVALIKDFGLRNKREFWKTQSVLRKYRRVARGLLASKARGEARAEADAKAIVDRLSKYGMLKDESDLDAILSLKINDFLERRLQTQVYRQGLSHSIRQARQFIVHGHIQISGRKVTVPGYLVRRGEEMTIEYYSGSPMSKEGHPERMVRIVKAEGS